MEHLHDLEAILPFESSRALNFDTPCFAKDIGDVLDGEKGMKQE